VYPALAVLDELVSNGSKAPFDIQNLSLWVGGIGGMEAEMVKRAGVPFTAIPAGQVAGVGARALPGNLLKLAKGFREARRIIGSFRPDVMLFTGGYLAVPVALAGRMPLPGQKRPRSLLYVPDIEPGLALKTLVRFADQVAITAEESRAFFPKHPAVTVTGYPLRSELASWRRETGQEALKLDPALPTLLVLGGSRGARAINRFLLAHLPALLPQMQIVHASGELDWLEVQAIRDNLGEQFGLSETEVLRYHAYPYLHKEMGAALAAADLVVSRAGASVLGELPLFGLPAVLIPYPYAWRYQKVNAAYLEERGAAVMLPEDEMPAQLLSLILDLINDHERRSQMQQAMQSLARPNAAGQIAALLGRLAEHAPQKGRERW
jgi:undecaprenyldiphospho-muramoylpentapeptide beta-N-acetylglucosaminyltransferase